MDSMFYLALGVGVGGWGRCTHVKHGRSRIYDHRPSHPYNAGTEHVGFSPTRQTLLAPSAKRSVRCRASRMKGELHIGVY